MKRMTKLEMLKEIAINTFEDKERGLYFAFRCKDSLKLNEVNELYAEYKTGIKNPEYFLQEIIGYTPEKKRRYLERHKIREVKLTANENITEVLC